MNGPYLNTLIKYMNCNLYFGQIEYHELINFVESTGVFLTQRYLGYQRKEIEGLVSFFDTLQNALLTNVKRIYVDVSKSSHLSFFLNNFV